jgi:hypothetical protein
MGEHHQAPQLQKSAATQIISPPAHVSPLEQAGIEVAAVTATRSHTKPNSNAHRERSPITHPQARRWRPAPARKQPPQHHAQTGIPPLPLKHQ